jgi:hypothetical protein
MTERDLHKSIRALLNAKRIVFFESRMDKRTTQRKGVPDFVFSVKSSPLGSRLGYNTAVAWEAKVGNGKLRPEQQTMFEAMQRHPNQWHCAVVRSLDDAIKELEALGL